MLTRQAILDLFPAQRAGTVPPANVQTFIGELGAFAVLRLTPSATLIAMTATYAAVANWTSSDSRGSSAWTLSTTAGTITVPVDDWYQVGFCSVHAPAAAAGTVTARPFVNGVVVPGIQTGSTGFPGVVPFGALSFAAPVSLLAGQVVDLRTNIDVPQNVNVGPAMFWLARML